MAKYDRIAENYAALNASRPLYKYAIYPSFYDVIGDVRKLAVMDIMTGEGLVSREMVARGASFVLGIDISKKMLAIANERKPLKAPIEYLRARVGRLGHIGQFHKVTGGWSLHYARSKPDLFRMCSDIALNLKPGGLFVGLNNNPWHPLCNTAKYDNNVTARRTPLEEGDKLFINYSVGDKHVAFENYYWRWNTYVEAMKAAGMSIEMQPVRPTMEGIRVMGKDWWRELEQFPWVTIFKCRKL